MLETISDTAGMHEHADLIEQLGGKTAVAEALWGGDPAPAKRRDVVRKWKRNGVPWRWRVPVARLAKERQIPVPPDFLPEPHDVANTASDRRSAA